MIYGIIVGFYPEYQKKSATQFRKLINSIDSNNYIIYVNNNPEQPTQNLTGIDRVISGDNRVWEFSGWDSALSYLYNNKNIGDDDIFLFANDTFCHHRIFTTLDRFIFTHSFKKHLNDANPWIFGEPNGHGITYSLLGKPFSKWASTYLFGVNTRFLNSINRRVSLDENMLKSVFTGIENGRINWLQNSSENLQLHLQKWLFPNNKKTGWYKASNDYLKAAKLKTILNEKYLSAHLFSIGGSIKPIYDSPMSYFYFRVKFRIFRLKKMLSET